MESANNVVSKYAWMYNDKKAYTEHSILLFGDFYYCSYKTDIIAFKQNNTVQLLPGYKALDKMTKSQLIITALELKIPLKYFIDIEFGDSHYNPTSEEIMIESHKFGSLKFEIAHTYVDGQALTTKQKHMLRMLNYIIKTYYYIYYVDEYKEIGDYDGSEDLTKRDDKSRTRKEFNSINTYTAKEYYYIKTLLDIRPQCLIYNSIKKYIINFRKYRTIDIVEI
jgi:hypothetical protein